MRCRLSLLVLLLLCAACTASAAPAPAAHAEAPAPFISPERFEQLRTQGATVVDARTRSQFEAEHVPGAVSAPWQDFVDGSMTGLLADTAALQERVRKLGVVADKPVVVYGSWNDAWGEEGRILWMLQYLGHPDVSLLAGGIHNYERLGFPLTQATVNVAPSRFVVAPREELRATAEEVLEATRQDRVVVLDIREAHEYEGATPYGSQRGGHVPTAVNFHWKQVFDASGQLLPVATLRSRFEALGIRSDSLVIAYCTGGIRSGFMYAVMRAAGYEQAQNYDGSWWEWSQRTDLPIE